MDQIVISEGFSVVQVCQVLGVSRSGYAAWCGEHATRREQDDARLMPIIEEVFWQHRRRYGARRIAVELNRRDLAWRSACKTVPLRRGKWSHLVSG